MNLASQLAIFWLLYPVGMCVHTLVSLLPLFAGAGVADKSVTLKDVPRHARMMVVTTSIPMIMSVGVLMIAAAPFRWLNLVLAVLLALANAAHLIQHLRRQPPDHVQNVFLTVILALSVLLSCLSFQWAVAG